MKVKVLSSDKSKQKILDILSSNNITVDENASIVILEDGYCNSKDFDVKIVFKEQKISQFSSLMSLISCDAAIGDIILGKKNDAYVPIKISDISYFNGINNDTFANLENGESYIVKKKLYQLEEELYSEGFFRINKSELINMKKINLIAPMFKGKLIVYINGYDIPLDISRGYTKEFKERLGF